ncbi:YdeI family protein [Ferruginibacter sp. HRS2-29]|uniref:YdeI/OmpD-associated family protein n=1 Tax=Ferruginibacter sp. HRS2-29 TaxID=2487334 RepID=UPI0020CFDED7|nr:YdeI/OmpD-associated family protein [Ferruginibacter sp. HRS2-29]MCP9750317.1 hypothetical protein [Ferruginibacter sp. HRS2-29]
MALETMFEKLQLKNEKNLLIQGLPSSIEKQFLKLNFAKSVTPLLRSRRIDFALVFAVNKKQLVDILTDVLPAMADQPNFWIAYPKVAAKIASDLTRDHSWECIQCFELEAMHEVELDNVWRAMRFMPKAWSKVTKTKSPVATQQSLKVAKNISVPEELKVLFKKNKPASIFFDSLSFTNKKEYVEFIAGAKKEETKTRRLDAVMEKLNTGKMSPSAK